MCQCCVVCAVCIEPVRACVRCLEYVSNLVFYAQSAMFYRDNSLKKKEKKDQEYLSIINNKNVLRDCQSHDK